MNTTDNLYQQISYFVEKHLIHLNAITIQLIVELLLHCLTNMLLFFCLVIFFYCSNS